MKRSNKSIVDTVLLLDYDELMAIQALETGGANSDMQKKAVKAICEKLCRIYDDTFDPKSERESNRMQGQRFVGLCIVEAMRANPSIIKKIKENQ